MIKHEERRGRMSGAGRKRETQRYDGMCVRREGRYRGVAPVSAGRVVSLVLRYTLRHDVKMVCSPSDRMVACV
jgi:hypothetical protein